MRYYFSLEQNALRKQDIMIGNKPRDIKLFPETPEIVDDYENNISSDWWGLQRHNQEYNGIADFDSIEEAYTEYYTAEGDDIYCRIHDC